MEEVWKPIEGYEGLYEVSNLGRIKSLRRDVAIPNPRLGIVGYRTYPERIKPCVENKYGYYQVTLSKEAKSRTLRVHRLVALAFIPNPDNKPYINHIDGNKKNNRVSNLEWCTASENTMQALMRALGLKGASRPFMRDGSVYRGHTYKVLKEKRGFE